MGQTIQQLRPELLTLPSGLGQVAVATEAAKSFQERQADSLEELIEIQRDARALLAAIAAAVDQSNLTNPAASEELVLTTLNNIKNLGIGQAM
jgi:hypothetical protein